MSYVKVKRTRAGIINDLNLCYLNEGKEGDWEIVGSWNRDHNCTPILCDFKLLQKGDEYLLVGSSANAPHWIFEKITLEKVEEMSMDDMAYYLEA